MAGNMEVITFEDLESMDVISVELVPERKGLILKHCEYYVSSRRFGTTVTRRYNEFAQLNDVLFAKYPYRAIPRLPPKRVVVGGGSPRFLQRRRAALQRWLSLVAAHPVLAHDADLRSFLCEAGLRLERPRHDEFTMAGTQDSHGEVSTEELQNAVVSEQEQLRLIHLGLGRLVHFFEKAECRWCSERTEFRELGAVLSALGTAADWPRGAALKHSLRAAAIVTSRVPDEAAEGAGWEVGEGGARLLLAAAALDGQRALRERLTRGVLAPPRQQYALRAALQEARIGRAYSLAALQSLADMFQAHGSLLTRTAAAWADLERALRL